MEEETKSEETPPVISKIKIGLVDDPQLFRKSLMLLLSSFKNTEVVMDATNGIDLQEKLAQATIIPDVMLIDVSMPQMDGPQTAEWLHQTYPAIRKVALSMDDKEETVIKMLRAGCCSYLFKDIHPNELEHALDEVHRFGYYNPAISYQKLMDSAQASDSSMHLTEKELYFLKLSCSDLSYRDIASIMNLSERTIDGYRATMFTKLNVQSRTGMALEAIRKGFVKL
ncbi:MAG: response regulator transcription factor [Cyclobacteriaceae bacterium]|nr:response regulator transcription factor [Cyclobacteriaceae bacterium]